MKQKTNEKKSKKKTTIWHYLISIAVEVGLLFAYFGFVGLFKDTELVDIYKHLSDGFLCVGAIAFCLGLLIYVGNSGGFNFLSFAALKVASKFVHTMKVSTMSYRDYVESKKQGDVKFGYLLITGGILLLACVVFVFLFYQVYEG